jgi:hypothetical protein
MKAKKKRPANKLHARRLAKKKKAYRKKAKH